MNQAIITRFEEYLRLLIECQAVIRFNVVKRNISPVDGRIRIRAEISDGSLLEFAEYIAVKEGYISERMYTFHWQDAQQHLMTRWDNVKHYPLLPFTPHHIHYADGSVVGNHEEPSLSDILLAIENQVRGSK